MPEHIITRKFRLMSLEAQNNEMFDRIFDIHRHIVNLFIREGSIFDYSIFSKDTLHSVKIFYDIIRKQPNVKTQLDQYKTKERLQRCAAQFAYFNIREHKRRIRKLKVIYNILIFRPDLVRFNLMRILTQKKIYPSSKFLREIRQNYIDKYHEYDGLNRVHLRNLTRYGFNILFNLLEPSQINRLQLEITDPYLEIELADIIATIIENIDDYISIPEFDQKTISFAIDDNQLYQLEETKNGANITLSFIPYERLVFEISTPDRYYDLIDHGYEAKRGILRQHNGKLLIHIPFSQIFSRVKPRETRVLGIDLGIKTLATLSLLENGIEIDRRFMDQKHLVGKKELWFRPDQAKDSLINFKRKLTNLQKRAFGLQSEMKQVMMRFKSSNTDSNRSYTNAYVYWKLRREWKQSWRKLRQIHREMIRQLSTRIVAYAVHYNVTEIKFEDLSWYEAKPRSKVGFFLSTWQMHFFHAQVQNAVENMAIPLGIKISRINPKDTSNRCSRCQEMGKRNRKQFHCSVCGLQLDSDLNAARNIAIT